MKVAKSERSRTFLIRADKDEYIPAGLKAALRRHNVTSGWVRGVGALLDAEITPRDADPTSENTSQKIVGTAEIVALDGMIWNAGDGPEVRLQATILRDKELFSGVIKDARVISLDLQVMALDEVKAEVEGSTWKDAARASADAHKGVAPAVLPPKFAAKATAQEDEVYPEDGAIVDHFAFGRCEVVKSDGDRLHVRMDKDGRIKEIALSILRVTPLPDEEGRHRFKLERKM